jgi:hypothetical protein
MKAEDIAVNLIRLSGGQVIGRTWLQEAAYLLDRCGAKTKLRFTYHYYGPYSFELADGWKDARAEGRIEIEEEADRFGIPYSIFKVKDADDSTTKLTNLGDLSPDDARAQLNMMAEVSNIVLELASTMVYLREEGYGEQAVKELKIRKPLKATDGLITKAHRLLQDLGLALAGG